MNGVALKRICELVTDIGSEEERPFIALEHVVGGTGQLDKNIELPRRRPASGLAAVSPGDVLFGKLRPYLAKTLRVSEQMFASTELMALRPAPNMDSRWLHYLLMSDQVMGWAVATSDGSKMPRTSWSDLGEFRVTIPELPEQRAIADYLDAETARIDTLIEKKRRLAKRLWERRVSIMLRGVAGQLTGVGEILDSGLPWLARRPRHWGEPLLKLVAHLGSGHTPSRSRPEWWKNCTIPWITTGEVAQMREDRIEYVTQTREKISELGMANSSAELHPSGTVVLSRTASAGFSAIMGDDMATSQDFVTWTCGPLLDPRYLLLCLRAMRHDLLGRLAQGSTHQTIYMPDIESIRIPMPPIDEQQEIVEAVWRSLRRLDKIIDLLNQQIELLTEHRQALITAAVTGLVEVPGERVKVS